MFPPARSILWFRSALRADSPSTTHATKIATFCLRSLLSFVFTAVLFWRHVWQQEVVCNYCCVGVYTSQVGAQSVDSYMERETHGLFSIFVMFPRNIAGSTSVGKSSSTSWPRRPGRAGSVKFIPDGIERQRHVSGGMPASPLRILPRPCILPSQRSRSNRVGRDTS